MLEINELTLSRAWSARLNVGGGGANFIRFWRLSRDARQYSQLIREIQFGVNILDEM